jgi:hypothetical protein
MLIESLVTAIHVSYYTARVAGRSETTGSRDLSSHLSSASFESKSMICDGRNCFSGRDLMECRFFRTPSIA